MSESPQPSKPNLTERWEVRWCMECGNLYTLTQYKSAHVCIQCGAPSENTILLAVIDSSVIARTARFAYTHRELIKPGQTVVDLKKAIPGGG